MPSDGSDLPVERRRRTEGIALPAETYAQPYQYFKSKFGDGDRSCIHTYNLIVNVSALTQDFLSFEDVPNRSAWPVSKIIQRELDLERARKIARAYLLEHSFLHYFPPLIAVILPIGADNVPLDAYPTATAAALENFHANFYASRVQRRQIFYEHQEPRGIARGIYDVPFDPVSGHIVWDKLTNHAIIIDGQHRRQALIEAAALEASVNTWAVPVILIDLCSLASVRNMRPTDCVRELFTTVNNTPEEVEDARIILMDDRDLLAGFAQVLVDDSSRDVHIPPELVDWHCKSGRHSGEYLTGIYTIYEIIKYALMHDRSVGKDYSDQYEPRKVQKWIDQLNLRLDADKVLAERLDPSTTLTAILRQIAPEDAEDTDSPIGFSLPAKVGACLKKRFRELYSEVFWRLFRKAWPYSKLYEIAEQSGLLSEESKLHEYYRSTVNRRHAMLSSDEQLARAVARHKGEAQELTGKNFLFSLMGQKAFFKYALRCTIDRHGAVPDRESTLAQIDEFIEKHNRLMLAIAAEDPPFFGYDFAIRTREEIPEAANAIQQLFWVGITLSPGKQLDYGRRSTELLVAILETMYSSVNRPDEVSIAALPYLTERHRGALQRMMNVEQSDELDELVTRIVNRKEQALRGLLRRVGRNESR